MIWRNRCGTSEQILTVNGEKTTILFHDVPFTVSGQNEHILSSECIYTVRVLCVFKRHRKGR